MTVLLCPGQGAQVPGMGRDVAERWPVARTIFARADEALEMDLSATVFEGSAADIERTDVCQPAILTVTVAIWHALLEARVVEPFSLTAALGLSLGEYTAHCIAGTLSFQDAVRLVHRRGQYMQEASEQTPSGMAAVMGLGLAEIEAICAAIRDEGGTVVVANLNAPGQVVISGENGALAAAVERMQAAGARRVVALPVAGAFHSPVMQPAADRLAADLAAVEFAQPRVPVISNVTAQPVTDVAAARETLARQVVEPVLFEKSLRHVLASGAPSLVEPGPGRTLSAFVRKVDRRAVVASYETAAAIEAA